MKIILPWPPKELSPNARLHWAEKAKLVKIWRKVGWTETNISGVKITGTGMIDLHITFNPPDKRRRDMDNMLSSAKSLLDGVADALGVNDGRFQLHLLVGEVVKKGRIVIDIMEV